MLEELIAEAQKLPYFDKDLIGDCATSIGDPRKYLMIASTLRETMGSPRARNFCRAARTPEMSRFSDAKPASSKSAGNTESHFCRILF